MNPTNKNRIQFLGAAGTVTGSRTRLETPLARVLVDFGMYQGPKEIRQKNWDPPEGLQGLTALILTHAHLDHSGLLPLLPKNGFRGPIYCSPATAELCRILLMDSAKLQEEDARFLNRTGATHFQPAKPLYTFDDVEQVLHQIQPVPDNQIVQISSDFSFRFHRAGHILGARMVEANLNSTRVFLTGDLGPHDPLILKEAYQPSETDYLIMESTYGDRCHEKGDRKTQLAGVINQVIGRGGTLVIPAFAVGRTQEILFLLGQLEQENRISKVPVYVDSPMALNTTEVYQKFEDELKPEIKNLFFRNPLDSTRFHAVHSADESMLLCMDTSPKIVISAAGMLTGGRVMHHLRMKLPDPKSGVLFVGYQVPGTKGDLLKKGLSRIRIHKQNVDIEADIFSMDSLSAHADHDDLFRWCQGFRVPPQRCFLIHGEDSAREALAYRLKTDLNWSVDRPLQGESFVIANEEWNFSIRPSSKFR